MLEIANDILERTVSLAEEFNFEDTEEIFEKMIGDEFEQIKEGFGVKIMDMKSQDNGAGIYIYFLEKTKLMIVTDLSSRLISIDEKDALELMALSYFARYLIKLEDSQRENLQKIAKEMQKIIDKVKEAAG